MAFAAETKVPVAQTRGEIETLLLRWRASRIALGLEPEKAVVGFRLGDRNIRFTLPLIPQADLQGREADKAAQENRARWRRLLLVIKGKFESIESGIETVDEAFLAHVQLADGRTIIEAIQRDMALEFHGKNMPLLLGPPRRQEEGER